MKHLFYYIPFLFLIIFVMSCKQSYEPAVIKANKNFLVVDGLINTGTNAVTTIKLSRTQNVTDSVYFSPENSAHVSILSKSGSQYPLHDQGNGVYTSDALNLNANDQYAVQVVTTGNSTYLSAFVSPKITPPIDSLQWQYSGNGVTIFLNAHDPQNNTRYYRWEYTETWEYHSYLEGELGLTGDTVFYNDPTTQTHICWQTGNSTNISLGTSIALSQDVISQDSITNVPQNDRRIGVRYSILVKQYALGQDAYQYWLLLQKNTQQLGSLFDAQPTQLTGNVTCTTNPSEPVLGYVSASSVEQARIFITNDQVPGWQKIFPGQDCAPTTIDRTPNNPFLYNYPDTSFMPYYYSGMCCLVIAKRSCLDCRQDGGTTTKPPFW